MSFDCQHGGPRGRFGGFQRGVKMRVLGASTGGIEASRGGLKRGCWEGLQVV